ncbi:rhamnan synthesis F family protein [Pseudophaeobacter leonis]|uniref:rhamnan synthesis F family protein n=1 Tax=Pseudophaeobacter leonis TaxID=1144477 RepID=UPI0009F34A9F|nr:rhamnan synthesis F family protein [Pseudophaeobacter leonis]
MRQSLDTLFHHHFDVEFYLSQVDIALVGGLSDGLADGLVDGQAPAAHFLAQGGRLGLSPCRWFDPLGYVAANPQVQAAGLNPFLHFLEFGIEAELRPMPFFRDQAWSNPDLQRFGRREYGPVKHILKFAEKDQERGLENRGANTDQDRVLAVHVHLFYPDMIDTMVQLLARLPRAFDLLVSVQDGVDELWVHKVFATGLPLARAVTERPGPNRGRDVASWLVNFQAEIQAADLFLHLHSKKSGHDSQHRDWFQFLGHSLLGSEAVAAQMLDLLEQDPGLGMVAPGYWPQLRRAPNYGKVRDLVENLCLRMGTTAPPPICPDFPAGSFFCCRASLLAPLFDLGLGFEDFPAEEGQICGTLAHAIERVRGLLPELAQTRFDMLAVDLPYEQACQIPPGIEPVLQAAPPASRGRVSVVVTLPTWQAGLEDRLACLLAQSHRPYEILLVDPGRSDLALRQITQRFADEIAAGYLRLMAVAAGEAAAGRNLALDHSRGDIICYFDCTSFWRPDYLAQLAAAYERVPAAQSIYSGLVRYVRPVRAGAGGGETHLETHMTGPCYDRAALVAADILDLSVFTHRRALSEDRGLRFDTALGDLASWDFILRATARQAPYYLEYTGVAKRALPDATEAGPEGEGGEAALPQQRRALQVKHRNERLYWQQDSFQVALKVPAPKPEFKHRWGDLHLANSLARALERLGCRTRVDILPDWYHDHPEDDVALVLRGTTPYAPRPEHINLMWHISHPSRVSLEEMAGFDHVFTASYPYAEPVIARFGPQASNMLQCADPHVFHDQVDLQGVPRHDLLFVGNSRKTARWMPAACVARDLPIAIYGAEWEGLIPKRYVLGTHVPNNRLAAYYRASKIVLNDHWADMAREGFVSNRIMDAGLAGALVVSDRFAGEEVFMGNVVTCDSPQEVEEAVRHYLHHDAERQHKARNLQQLVQLHHTVDHRARQVLQTIQALARDRMRQLR